MALDLSSWGPRFLRNDDHRQGVTGRAGGEVHDISPRYRDRADVDRRHRKWLIHFPDGKMAEAVPFLNLTARCVFRRRWLHLACKFCHTGTQRMVRNLTPGEIVGQFMLARSYGEWPSSLEPRLLTNIVMMGMGEPLYNYDNAVQAPASSCTRKASTYRAA